MRRSLSLLLCLWLLAGCGQSEPDAAQAYAAPAPEATAPWAHGWMATVANPDATAAAAEMLAQGGHAVDAAIAAHAVLGLVEPESSGRLQYQLQVFLLLKQRCYLHQLQHPDHC